MFFFLQGNYNIFCRDLKYVHHLHTCVITTIVQRNNIDIYHVLIFININLQQRLKCCKFIINFYNGTFSFNLKEAQDCLMVYKNVCLSSSYSDLYKSLNALLQPNQYGCLGNFCCDHFYKF